MQKILKFGNAKLYLHLGILLLLALLWKVGETINIQLGMLPVKEVPKSAKSTIVIDEKSFYPVWVKQDVAKPQMAIGGEVDSLFKREQEKESVVKQLEPDYGKVFQQALKIDGVAEDGLFINGHFYTIGSNLEAYAMLTSKGERLVPKLESVRGNIVQFDLGTRKIVITMHGKT